MLEISATFEEFQLVFNFMLFFHFNTIFFNSWKMQGSKILGGLAPQPPSAPVSTGLVLVYSSGLFFGSNETFKKDGVFHIDLNDSCDLLLPYYSGCKNKGIKQKTNPAASEMKSFMTLVDGLFGKELNNITKKHISDDPRSTSLLSIFKKRV